MFVRKATTDTSVLLHRETIQKHGSHDQKTHGRKGGGGRNSGASILPTAKKDLDSLSSSLNKKRKILSTGPNEIEYTRKLGNGQTQKFEISKREALAALDKSQDKINQVSNSIGRGDKLKPNKDIFTQTDYDNFEKIGIIDEASAISERIFEATQTMDRERQSD